MNKRKPNGQFGRNNIRWEVTGDIAYCYSNGELLFFTDVDQMPRFENLPIAKMADGYAGTRTERGTVLVHRFIINAEDGTLVDHINRNKQDDRLKNLRIADRSVNAFNSKVRTTNSSGVTGVHFRKDTKRWTAEIKKGYKKHCLGCFATKEEAIEARKRGEKLYYGSYQQ